MPSPAVNSSALWDMHFELFGGVSQSPVGRTEGRLFEALDDGPDGQHFEELREKQELLEHRALQSDGLHRLDGQHRERHLLRDLERLAPRDARRQSDCYGHRRRRASWRRRRGIWIVACSVRHASSHSWRRGRRRWWWRWWRWRRGRCCWCWRCFCCRGFCRCWRWQRRRRRRWRWRERRGRHCTWCSWNCFCCWRCCWSCYWRCCWGHRRGCQRRRRRRCLCRRRGSWRCQSASEALLGHCLSRTVRQCWRARIGCRWRLRPPATPVVPSGARRRRVLRRRRLRFLQLDFQLLHLFLHLLQLLRELYVLHLQVVQLTRVCLESRILLQ